MSDDQHEDDGQLDADELEQNDMSEDEQHEADDEGDGDELDAGDSFPRAYVEQIRRRSQTYRHRAQVAEQRADELGRELFRARVADLGVLADPDDLDYDPELLGDDDELRAAADELVQRRPHLAARRARGNIGQHEAGSSGDGFSLSGALRSGA